MQILWPQWKAFFSEEGLVSKANQQWQDEGDEEEIKPVITCDISIENSNVNMLPLFEHKVNCFKAGRLRKY